jgi:hypothetical protein
MMRFFVSAGILAAMVGAAEAAPKCSPGKIYRVSKKVCVDKAEALRDGVISASQKKQKASTATRSARLSSLEDRKANRERAPQALSRESEETPPAPLAETASSARTVIQPPVQNVMGSASSPFGALVDQWTSGSVSALPENRFSLQLTTVD